MKKRIVSWSVAALAVAFSAHVQAASYTLSSFATEDLGLNLAGSTSAGPYGPTTFTSHPYAATSDADKGCDKDTFFNFAGGGGATNVPMCGDTLLVQWTGGSTSNTASTLTTTTGNGTGFEFHIEDSAGSGTQHGNLVETLTNTGDSSSKAFEIPYTITYGFSSDTMQIGAFDISVCTNFNGNSGNCHTGDQFFVISAGTSVLGFPSSDDDDFAFETGINGCVATTDSCTGSTTLSVTSFFAPDPPADDVPEPASLAILGSALACLRLARRRAA